MSTMAGGWEHTLALTRCGEVFSFGGGYIDAHSGSTAPVLGFSASHATEKKLSKQGFSPPTKLCEDALGSVWVKAIASGWDHCLAVTEDGTLFTWGAGSAGQLGHGDTGKLPTNTLGNKYTYAKYGGASSNG